MEYYWWRHRTIDCIPFTVSDGEEEYNSVLSTSQTDVPRLNPGPPQPIFAPLNNLVVRRNANIRNCGKVLTYTTPAINSSVVVWPLELPEPLVTVNGGLNSS